MLRAFASGRREDGATMLFVTASMLLLLGFAALAIDAGSARNERRQDQSGADVAALAAVQFAKSAPTCSGAACLTTARTAGALAAIEVANSTVNNLTLADWQDASRCGSPPAGFTVSPITNCVAFTSNNLQAWVHIPDITSPTYFARVLGFVGVKVTAEAIAGQELGLPGTVLPFLLPGNATGTDYNCLKTSGNPNWGPCETLPATGNFGSMDFFLYGSNISSAKCSGDTNGRLVYNISRGVDHALGLYKPAPPGGTEFRENDLCPGTGNDPNTVQGQSGVASNLDDGMLRGGSAYSTTGAYLGRIQVPIPIPAPVPPPNPTNPFFVRSAQGSNPDNWIDNTPLWTYLKTGLGTLGGENCNKTDVDTPQEMINCIKGAKSVPTVIFEDTIIQSKRFGFTPEVWELDFLTPGSYYHIKDYRPVYVDMTLFNCGANTCSAVHTVGVADGGGCGVNPNLVTCGTPVSGNRTLSAVTAYILSQDLLPTIAKTPLPGADNQRTYNLTR